MKLGSTASYFPHSFYDCISATSVQITQERQAFVIKAECLYTPSSWYCFLLILMVQELDLSGYKKKPQTFHLFIVSFTLAALLMWC